jgi:hypothetical protein
MEATLKIKPLGYAAPVIHANSKSGSSEDQRPTRISHAPSKDDIAKIIEAAAATAIVKPQLAPTAKEENGGPSKQKITKKHQTQEEKEANKEKRLQKLVGGIVVKCMSKYQKQMDHDLFKKHAKEVCAFHYPSMIPITN